jgi:hypothetical protein
MITIEVGENLGWVLFVLALAACIWAWRHGR